MLPIDVSSLPRGSAVALVARSSDAPPDFVLADRPKPRFLAARWHRRRVWLDQPMQLDHHLVSYCERGGAMATIVLDDVCNHVQQVAGAVTFLPAGHRVRWSLDAPTELVHVHLYIAREVVREELRACAGRLSAPTALMNVRDPWLDSFFHLMQAEHEACQCSGDLQRFDLLDRVGGLLVRRLLTLQASASPAADRSRIAPLRPFLLREIESYVDAHLGERILLHRLAMLAGMSVDHFVRAFSRATGATPHRWVMGRRLDAASSRLRTGTEPVETIARHLGFAGAAHFSAAFRRQHGVTPTAFRRGAWGPAPR
jgi:AraC family transcriptional regulator